MEVERPQATRVDVSHPSRAITVAILDASANRHHDRSRNLDLNRSLARTQNHDRTPYRGPRLRHDATMACRIERATEIEIESRLPARIAGGPTIDRRFLAIDPTIDRRTDPARGPKADRPRAVTSDARFALAIETALMS